MLLFASLIAILAQIAMTQTRERGQGGEKKQERDTQRKEQSLFSHFCSSFFFNLCTLSLLGRIVPLCCTIKPNNSNIITAISPISLFCLSRVLIFLPSLSTLKTPPCLAIFDVSVTLCMAEMNTTSSPGGLQGLGARFIIQAFDFYPFLFKILL